MSTPKQVMHMIDSHDISNRLVQSDFGGLLSNGEYAWFASGSSIIVYSKSLGAVLSHRSFADTVKITCVLEFKNCEKTCNNFLLIGCSFKSSGILYVCQLLTLKTVSCIDLPSTVSAIAIISNNSHVIDQFCDEFKIMSTVLLIGMTSGAVYAVDLRQSSFEKQLRQNESIVNELKPNKLFIIRKNKDYQEVKEMSNVSDSHLAMFINKNVYAYCKKQYNGKLQLNITSLLYIKEINTIAIGYSTGHFQLWDCKVMQTIYFLKKPKCVIPVTKFSFLEPSDDPNNLCYLWVIQSDNSKLPSAKMIALTYQQKTLLSDGSFLYEMYLGNSTKLEMSLEQETGIGRCVSALSLCNPNLFRNETDIDEDCEIRLFVMLLEVLHDVNCDPESYIFLFDINQWYKALMPSTINHLKVSNSYASFVKLPHNISYLDFNISNKSLRPFRYNFRNYVEELYYPSSIYFECNCLLDSKIIKYKHAGIQQEILDQLLSRSWRLLTNPSLVFSQCLETNLKPFFWDESDDYSNYSLPDQRSFVVSIIVENNIIPVLRACAEAWKNGIYVSIEATILHLVKCLWKHVMVVKQYADKLCVPLFDHSGTQLYKKDIKILNYCISQIQCVKNFLEFLHNEYGVHVINVDCSQRVSTLNLVVNYFKAVICFLKYTLLPECLEDDFGQSNVQCNLNYLIQYANKRRIELGDSKLYLIDALIFNEAKRSILIEQWLHESGEEETKSMYPPHNLHSLLRIYLSAAPSDSVKNFVIVYFLIDVCSSQNMNVALANRMCNFALEVDIPNYKGLNLLCRASWLLDHDMFEEAMQVLSSDKNKWIMFIDKFGDWFHWTILKLLVFKSEYSWALFYFELVNINMVETDDQKFFINVQIMNNRLFDVLKYIHAQSLEDQEILYEYLFERCRKTHKLKCLLKYVWNPKEEELLCSYLKRVNDLESLTCLLFLLERGKHLGAAELNKLLEDKPEFKKDDLFTITCNLVNKFDKGLPEIFKQNYDYHPVKNLYKKSVTIKCVNYECKMFNIADKEKESILKIKNPSITESHATLILPPRNNKQKRSHIHDSSYNGKCRKTDILLSPPGSNNKEISNLTEKNILEILNTPLEEKIISLPSNAICSSILKTGSATKLNRVSALKTDETLASKTVLRFSLPGDNNTTIEQLGSGEKQVTNIRCANDVTNLIEQQSTEIRLEKFLEYGPEKQSNKKKNKSYEKMDVSEECSTNHVYQEKLYMDSNLSTENVEFLVSKDENDEKKKSVTKLSESKNSTFNENKYCIKIGSHDQEMETLCYIPTNGNENHIQQSLIPSSNTNFEETGSINQQYSDEEDVVAILDSEIESIHSDSSSSESFLEDIVLSSDSDIDKTKHCRFKQQKKKINEESVDLSQEFNGNKSDEKEVESEPSDKKEIELEQRDGEEVELEQCNKKEVELEQSDKEEVESEQSDKEVESEQSNEDNLESEQIYEDDLELDQSYESVKEKGNSSEYCKILLLSSDDTDVDVELGNSVSLEEKDTSEIFDTYTSEVDNSKSDVHYNQNKHFEQNVDINKKNEDNELEEFSNVQYLKDNDNTFEEDNGFENMFTFVKEDINNDVETECTAVLKLDSCENLTHNSFELVEESCSLHYKGKIVDVEGNIPNSDAKEYNYDIYVKDTQNVDNPLQKSFNPRTKRSISISSTNSLYSNSLKNENVDVKEISLNSLEQQPISENQAKLRRSRRLRSKQSISITTARIKVKKVPADTLDLSLNKSIKTKKIKYTKKRTTIKKNSMLKDRKIILRRSIRLNRNKLLDKTSVEMKLFSPTIDKNITKKKQSILEKTDEPKCCDQQFLQGNQKIHTSFSKSAKNSKDITALQKTHAIKKSSTQGKDNKPSTSKSCINEQVDKDANNKERKFSKTKSISTPRYEIVTRLRAQNKSHTVYDEISSNIFHSSEMVEESMQKRVILSKKSNEKQNDSSLTETNDSMDLKKKSFGPSKKTQKRPSSEPVEKETKQKITGKVKQNIARSDLNISNNNLNDSPSSSSYKQFSSIPSQKFYSPVTNKMKLPPKRMTALNFETNDLAYERAITSGSKNNSYVKLVFFDPTKNKVEELKSESKNFRQVKKCINTSKVRSFPKQTSTAVLNIEKSDKSLKSKQEKKKISAVRSLDVETDISERKMTRSQ